jgi:isopentenyl phosphate kinase
MKKTSDGKTKKLYFVKFGGSVITNTKKRSTPKIHEIDRLLKEVDEARTLRGFDVIIGHGSGSFAHVPAKKYKVNEGLKYSNSMKGSVITLKEAANLDNIVVDRAMKLGIPVFPFSAHSFGMSEAGHMSPIFIDGIKAALKQGFIPIVYGDVVIDKNKGVSIASTEEILVGLSKKLKPNKIILGTDVDGVFTKDPRIYKDAKLIRRLDKSTFKRGIAGAGDSVGRANVTGGMQGKLTALYKAISSAGATGYIINAATPGNVKKVLLGEDKKVKCTVVRA